MFSIYGNDKALDGDDSLTSVKKDPPCNLHICILRGTQDRYSPILRQINCATNSLEVYACKNCNFQTSLVMNFKNHFSKSWRAFKCDGCHFETYSRLVLLNHERKHCRWTSTRRLNVASLQMNEFIKCQHFLKNVPPDINGLECAHCEYDVILRGDLETHLPKQHGTKAQGTWLECDQCLFNVEQVFHLREHLLTVHSEDSFEIG